MLLQATGAMRESVEGPKIGDCGPASSKEQDAGRIKKSGWIANNERLNAGRSNELRAEAIKKSIYLRSTASKGVVMLGSGEEQQGRAVEGAISTVGGVAKHTGEKALGRSSSSTAHFLEPPSCVCGLSPTTQLGYSDPGFCMLACKSVLRTWARRT